jgi:hypothetical protein
MTITDRFSPAVSEIDRFDQKIELARIAQFARSLRRPDVPPYAIGILKFIEEDLLRYGVTLQSWGLKEGFGVVRESESIFDWIDREIEPLDYMSSILLYLLAEGKLIVNPVIKNGERDFYFYANERPRPSDRIN